MSASSATLRRWYPLLMVLFAGSGCAALIYELVWYQMLQLAIGSQAISLGFLLAAFMGGLCLGSLALPRWLARQRRAGRSRHPLKIYAALEAATAALALAVMVLMPLAERVYFAASATGLSNLLLRTALASLCLLPPTIVMGASLPAMVAWIETSAGGVAMWGLLYGANTAGAVFGCLWAGFFLLRNYNMIAATLVAAAVNLVVAGLSWMLAARTPATARAEGHTSDRAPAARGGDGWVYVVIGLSGATALGAEVVWTRLFGMLMGATVYAFSIILAVFLVGLAAGSAAGAAWSRRLDPRRALGWSQMLLALAIAWTAWMISSSLPYWPINPLLTPSPWYVFQLDLARCLWAILPAALCWGASFPLALAAVSREGDEPSARMGAVYAANTVGAIVGALGVSIVLVPAIGTRDCERLMLLLAGAAALIAWAPRLKRPAAAASGPAPEARPRPRRVWTAAGMAMSAALCIWLASALQPVPGALVAYGRKMAVQLGSSRVLDVVEGRNSSVAITQWNDGNYEVDVNGHVEATTEPFDMKLQRMVGYLPALAFGSPKSVLGIGFGAGVSAGTFTRLPSIQKITICEIEPVIPPTSTRYFSAVDYDVKDNPKTHMVYDDARHYLLTTRDTFDIIASDPLDVFVKGTAAIYSQEYFEAVKRHLNPGGYFSLYVPLYESDVATVQSEFATFFAVFPNATVWGNTVNGQGYDLVLMGQRDPLQLNLDAIDARLDQPDYAPVRQSLADIGITSTLGLFATYGGDAHDLRSWTAAAPLNLDRDLKLQYMGGWGIDSSQEEVIWQQILAHRQMPVGIFRGSPEELDALFGAIQQGSAGGQ